MARDAQVLMKLNINAHLMIREEDINRGAERKGDINREAERKG